ncbi:type VI secretion system amidase effector protein Tae4 [Nannocystis radixulma]|uniref:Type VI secretion system amidase effector protein Tae4 n=1 Tax=Nannocystis radixulma TaxID=2995305 RepID=A0ABT5BCS4_9BACT|nr:type VI secretion system amidase effector protein Tae4 [Nannocystis radixulma]MDC0671942.1 type VI secretion system amidase effector protein Tae4 [Nannocystis radixulma]
MSLSFDDLNNNYPTGSPCDEGWPNQCAIRVSIALEKSGFPLNDYTDPPCKHGHARGAESLAKHLWRKLGRPTIATHASAGSFTTRGIIFFKDIKGFRNGVGDHIDLWNGTHTRTGAYFGKCKQVWFFAI